MFILFTVSSVTPNPEKVFSTGICPCAQQPERKQVLRVPRQLLPFAHIALRPKHTHAHKHRKVDENLTCVHLRVVGNRFRIGENIHRRRDVLFWIETVRDRVY